MSVEDVFMVFSRPDGARALEYLKKELKYDDSTAEFAAEMVTGKLAESYCPVRMAFRAGMREAIVKITTAMEAGRQQIDARSNDNGD